MHKISSFRRIQYLLVFVLSLLMISVISPKADAAYGDASTFLGKIYYGDGLDALSAYLDMPRGMAMDAEGSLIIADTANNVIRKINSSGIVSTISGSGDYGNFNGPVDKATWSNPEGIAVGSDGVIYVADAGSNSIRKIKNGVVTPVITKENGLKRPNAVIISGNKLYISDGGNNRVISAPINGGNITIITTGIASPMKLAIYGNALYVADLDSGSIFSINLTTKIKTAIAEDFVEPRALVIYNGILYITAGPSGIENEIWTINLTTNEKTKLVTRRETETLNQTSDILIGTWNGVTRLILLQTGGSAIYTTDLLGQDLQQIAGKHRYGDEMGVRADALVGRIKGLVVSPDKTKVYISYAQGNKIAVYDLNTDKVQVLAGHLMDNYRESIGESARFSDVPSMAISSDGNTLYIADRNSHRIRSVNTQTGETKYLTGAGIVNLIDPSNPSGVIDPNYKNGYQEGGPCPETFTSGVSGCAYFNRPTGVVLTSNGKTLYVADGANHRIRQVDIATGNTSFIAGSGKEKFINGLGSLASFNGPNTLALSLDNKILYVADKYNHAIRAINLSTKLVTTVAGQGKAGFKDGALNQAFFSIPEYVIMGSDGKLYVSEVGGSRIRVIDLTKKTVSTLSGSGEKGFRNGKTELAKWNTAKGIAILNNKLLVADLSNDLLRSIDLTGKPKLTESEQEKIKNKNKIETPSLQFNGMTETSNGGADVSVGDIDGNDKKEIIVGSGEGVSPKVRIYNTNGKLIRQFVPFSKNMKNGVKIETCDLNGDGKAEILVVPGKGATPELRIYNGNGRLTKSGVWLINKNFKNGVNFVCADLNLDGKSEIIAVQSTGGTPRIYIYNYQLRLTRTFLAYSSRFTGGVELGLADTNGDGIPEIVTSPRFGVLPIYIFNALGKKQNNKGFYAFGTSFIYGATVDGGDLNGDGKDDLIFGSGPGIANEVRIFSATGAKKKTIDPYANSMIGGLQVISDDINGDGKDDVIITPNSGGKANIKIYKSK